MWTLADAPPAPARPSALELKLGELEAQGLLRVLRGPGDAIAIDILPVASAAPGRDAATPGAPVGLPCPGA